ncbi:MAG: hemolysin family protein [Gemmatimonadota bacterium]
MAPLIAVLALLILVSGFFSGSEIALFSVPESRAQALMEEGRRGARALVSLKQSPERLLIAILVGNNVANIAAASIATFAATRAFGSAGVGLATGVMTLAVLFFGEVIPKSFAAANAVPVSLAVAPLFRGLLRVLAPFVVPLHALTRIILPTESNRLPGVTEREIRALTRMGQEAGSIDPHERELIERVFTLDTTRAWEVMTPRVDIFAWSDALSLDDIADDLKSVPFSRIPVHGSSLDDVTGILYTRDAYQALTSGQGKVALSEVAREPMFVPASATLVRLLSDFQTRRIHLGVVVDEHGGTDGLITLEDILEELVGEIADETDVPDRTVLRVGRNDLLVDGGVGLRELNHFFNTGFPTLEHRSLNGYLLEELGRVPQAGETIVREGVRIEVRLATDTQVERARLSRVMAGDHVEPQSKP